MLKKIMVVALTAFYIGSTCQAAVSDAGMGDYYKKEKNLYQEKTVPDKDNVTDKTPPEEESSQPNDISIQVDHIIVDKSEILQEAELRAIVTKYEGKKLTINDLHKAVEEIKELYKIKGYITAKAFLPPQKIENGIVKIQLVEGCLGEFELKGNQHTNVSYIQDRISLKPGDLLKLDNLEKDISYFNNTNDVAMRAQLRPGKEAGTTDCVLQLQEPDEWQVTMFSDNAGSEESGRYRTGMILANNSLFGNREALVLNPTWSKGTLAGSASLTLPVDRLGTRLGISYSKNQTNIISGPYESLNIQGNSSDIGVSVNRPLVVAAKYKSEGYGELHWKDADTDMAGTAALLASKTKTATLGANFRTLEDKTVWYNQLSYTAIASTKKDAYADKRFSRINFSTICQEEVNKDTSLIWRLSGQWTDSKELPSTERFFLGGMSSVKGFKESFADGDKGYYAGVEYDFPIQSPNLKGLLFVDHGSTYNNNENGSNSKDDLTSTGIGLLFNCSPNIFGKVILGVPLASSKAHDATCIHFYLQSSIK